VTAKRGDFHVRLFTYSHAPRASSCGIIDHALPVYHFDREIKKVKDVTPWGH
jgi:hypothetical protein